MHPQVRWVLSWQAILAAASAVAAGFFWGTHSGISALMGGFIGVVANAGYVWRAMRLQADTDPVRIYQAQAAGEALKFALTLVLFALVFLTYKEVAALPLFLAYAANFAVYWAALLKQR